MTSATAAIRIPIVLAGMLAAFAVAGTAQDHSGTYYVTVGHTPRFTLEIRQAGSAVAFTLSGEKMVIEGDGTASGNTMALAAPLGEDGSLSIELTFSTDGMTFAGTWEFSGGNPSAGTITGTKTAWPTYDLEVGGVPLFVGADCIELWKIDRISKLRSGAGHDYSDDFETCRSMKHYFLPRAGVDRSTIVQFAPVTGTVIGTTDEWEGTLWKGTAVGIRPDGYPAFDVVIYHVDLAVRLGVGDRVAAGQALGTSEKASGTVADIAIGVHTPQGYKLVSYFEAMPDGIFALYVARGVSSRQQLIIPREERDAHPLTCEGDQIPDPGTLENWVYLTAPPPPSGLRRRIFSIGTSRP